VSSWSPTSREEQQSLVDMIGSAFNSLQHRYGGTADASPERRVACPGDFPREQLSAEMTADIIYALEHQDYTKLDSEEIVGRLARARDDERRRQAIEALALSEMKQAAFTANGQVAAVAIGSGVMGPEARAELKAQSEADGGWYDGASYKGFLGADAYEHALVNALPEGAKALTSFLDSLAPNTGLWSVYDAIRNVVQPSYYAAYVKEYLDSLQLEGDDVLERPARNMGQPDDYLRAIDDLRLRLPSDTYRLVDLLTPEMLMSEPGSDRWSSRGGAPRSLDEILACLRQELDRRGWAESQQLSETLAAKRQQEDPHYQAILDAATSGKTRSAAELVKDSLAAEDAPTTFVMPAAIESVSQRSLARQQPRFPCFLKGGHTFAWAEPRKEHGLWFVKQVCTRCSEVRDYQIGSSSEDGHRWSAEGGTAPPPRKYWALNPHGHPQSVRSKVSDFFLGLLALGVVIGIPLGLIFVVVMFFVGLSQGIGMSQRPAVLGNLRPGLVASADHGAWRWQKQDFLLYHTKGEPYGVQDSQWGYRWQLCNRGACHDIPGATTSSYTIARADDGKYLRVWIKIGPPPGKAVYKDIPAAASAPRLVKDVG
jgi:hypothetical protein